MKSIWIPPLRQVLLPTLLVFGIALSALAARAQDAPASWVMRQTIAEGVAGNEPVAAFYRARGFAPIWTAPGAADRRAALLAALSAAGDHGLPTERYDPEDLRAAFAGAATSRARAEAEVLATTMFLQYARDVQSGVLDPATLGISVFRDAPRRDPGDLLAGLVEGDARAFLRSLPPDSPEYVRLMRERFRLAAVIDAGGWGPEVPAGVLRPGDSGPAVIALRDRLIAMGYLRRSAAAEYDAALTGAVRDFQDAHGLAPDGIAGRGTIAEINRPPEARLEQVIVHMERQRWMNFDRGARHVLVNIPQFRAYVVDDGEVGFETRVVVGHTDADRNTPEFSDLMEHLVINPSWNVPRSIAVNEYLPELRANPYAAGHLEVLRAGRPVSRAGLDFSQYTAQSFPFDLRQPPGPGNALGRVKFMFPNRFNIYLHDTPARELFDLDERAFSHGCVRVQRPLALAYFLLEPQAGAGAQALFDTILATGRETTLPLEVPVPVHLVYRTVWVTPDGRAQYRRDIYGRNAAIWTALERAGVTAGGVSS